MANRLAGETSPYLLQHAGNPVDWYPWGSEARERARREDKPILLSVGYSACHWCHVMAHESFEDPAVAAVMNALFVNVKVDREERPDLDQIYQAAHALLTRRSGGWPLTMFLTPDGRAVLRRHVFSEGGALRAAGVHRPAAARRGGVPRAARGDRRAERAADRGAREHGAGAAGRGRRRRGAAGGGAGAGARRVSRGASIPSTAASARRPSFRTRPTSRSACASTRCTR